MLSIDPYFSTSFPTNHSPFHNQPLITYFIASRFDSLCYFTLRPQHDRAYHCHRSFALFTSFLYSVAFKHKPQVPTDIIHHPFSPISFLSFSLHDISLPSFSFSITVYFDLFASHSWVPFVPVHLLMPSPSEILLLFFCSTLLSLFLTSPQSSHRRPLIFNPIPPLGFLCLPFASDLCLDRPDGLLLCFLFLVNFKGFKGDGT